MLFLLVVIGLGLYPLLISGWASNRKYALIGAMRGVAQTISYEIRLALLLFRLMAPLGALSLFSLSAGRYRSPPLLIAPTIIMVAVACVAETNRTPFDFAEGESELVSGFNIEYGAFGFALIFMAEYASILFLSRVLAMVALGVGLGGAGAAGAIALAI